METLIKEEKNPIKSLFAREDVQVKFKELMGKRASSFITSVLQIVASSDQLIKADPSSVYQAAAVAATLDLPLNNNLGFAYIVPFNQKQKDGTYKTLAQFQLGAKGFRQLALRTGQFLTIHETDVREGEIKKVDRLSGEMEFEWIQDEKERLSKKVVGYVSYFKLVNGYEQTYYMTVEKLNQHGSKYSQTFKKGFGLWKDDFDAMARKTVIKLNLSKNAPLSVEMQKALTFDQSVVKDADSDTVDIDYVDNEKVVIDKEAERIALMIEDAKSVEELKAIEPHVGDAQMDLFNLKFQTLTA